MVQSFGYPRNGSIVSRAVAAAAANNHHSTRRGGRSSKRYSVSAFYSMAAEQDNEVEDDLAKGKKKAMTL
jgi:Ras GTPase-activating-like protein IQGAP2/3